MRQAVERWEFYHRQISVCDEQIQTHLQTLQDPNAGEPPAPKVRRRKRKANGPRFDARREVYRVTKVDLTAIEGIEETTALVLLGEIGTDMSKWPSSKQFCSWLGLCPQVRQSAGKVLSSKVRAGPNRAGAGVTAGGEHVAVEQERPGFILPADRGASGRAKAVTATAHKLGAVGVRAAEARPGLRGQGAPGV